MQNKEIRRIIEYLKIQHKEYLKELITVGSESLSKIKILESELTDIFSRLSVEKQI